MTGNPGSSSHESVVMGDDGLQIERTVLSWQRTGGALVVLSAAGIRCSAMINQLVLAGFTSLIAICAAGFAMHSARRPRSAHHRLGVTAAGRVHVADSGAVRMLVLSALVSAMGMTAFVIALLLMADH
ncbi:MAG: hypothetical protein DI630_27305 [Gordonia sp. (in: high G+C Gram-positive bacteria)]|nr:MAG: hypothetical protein DI630_27305 [Gordonia sp. (in: high G+C Gram-positive bacteria)]